MKQYEKKKKLIETKLFISLKFTISKIHKNFTICVTRMRDYCWKQNTLNLKENLSIQ